MHGVLDRLLDGGDLARHEARALMDRIMEGEVPSATLSALLVALRLKGESVDEITGFAEAMRERSVKIPVSGPGLVDTCGTGGDAKGTFNLSTATALTAAAMGARVAKHGNRAVSSRSGSADVLETLGVDLNLTPAQVALLLEEIGIGFMFAPSLHPAMKHAMPVRQELGVRTVFNVLGPLTNPAGADRQLLGVYDARLCEPVARVLAQLGAERAFVVHGMDGLDEVSPSCETFVAEVTGGQVRTFTFRPRDVDLVPVNLDDLVVEDADASAHMIRDVLTGRAGPAADAVVLNAAFVAVACGLADDFRQGAAEARATLVAGKGMQVLESLVARSQTLARETS
ncbi:MAG: anthranilate phosphoribosyltransferase [bacterium]|nr:anthranilate phosphoribosyltransferase [bacterium]